MSTSSVLLSLLERAPAHGYTLKRDFDLHFGQRRPLAFGQVYQSLARFERDGLAEVVDVGPGSGPERKRYRITPDGVAEVDRWVYSPQDPDVFATSGLFARVAVALMSGRSAESVLDEQRAAHMERMRDLQAQRRGAGPAEVLSVTYELVHLDADLRWIEDSGKRLDALRAAFGGAS
ncbi:MAG: PadR family transcriptional regulator [Dehalococcoidia bacterium]